MIEIKNLSKVFHTAGGDVEALKDIDLRIEDGDIFGIIGLSGAGKSTLVRCMNLLEVPSEGRVLWKCPARAGSWWTARSSPPCLPESCGRPASPSA